MVFMPTFASSIRQNNKIIKNMKRRILYVGTLVDLAQIFESDEEQESEEFFQSMLNIK